MKEYRFIGRHADELNGGRPIEPGDFTGQIANSGHNKDLIDDGLLIEVEDGTTERVAKAKQAALRKAEEAEAGKAEVSKGNAKNDDGKEGTER